jgi:hypothetical protein
MTQQPMDMNKLKAILGKSRAVMDAVEDGNYQTGNVDGNSLVQEGLVDSLPDGSTPQQSLKKAEITEDMIESSNLPPMIKEAMRSKPIPSVSMTDTFTLDDVEDLVEKPIPAPQSKPRQRQIVNETIQQPVNMGEERMRQIVQEEMTKFFSTYFMKNITEVVQKQTIKNLISTGVLKPKKK